MSTISGGCSSCSTHSRLAERMEKLREPQPANAAANIAASAAPQSEQAARNSAAANRVQGQFEPTRSAASVPPVAPARLSEPTQAALLSLQTIAPADPVQPVAAEPGRQDPGALSAFLAQLSGTLRQQSPA